MVLCDHRQELLQQRFGFVCVQLVDVLWERPDGKDALPPRDGVGADDGVHGLEARSDVQRVAALALIELDRVGVIPGCSVEAVADESGGEAFKELLVGLREPVVDLVPRSPESVATGLGKLRQAQRGVVCWHGLKLDVRVPCGRVVLLPRGVLLVLEDGLALRRADGADLVVADAELGRVVENGVDVERRVSRLAGQLAKAVYKLLLQVVCEVVLGAEEDDPTL